jgi:hypothetical protein
VFRIPCTQTIWVASGLGTEDVSQWPFQAAIFNIRLGLEDQEWETRAGYQSPMYTQCTCHLCTRSMNVPCEMLQ